MALVLTDPQGISHMAQAPTQEDENANADGMLQVKLIENEQTKEYIDKIGELWTITNVTGEDDKREYVVVLVEPERWKDKMTVTLTARLKHFDYLATHRVYEDVTGSRTNIHYFEAIFADTPYSFTFLNHADAVEWENAGQGDDKLSMFLKGVERYGYEWRYEYQAKQFILGKNLNRRPAYYFSKKLNANNVKIETDATEFYTYVRGFGDFEDDAGYTTAKLTMDYPAGAESPMIDLFGIREAEPVMDGRISKSSTMERYMQDKVDPSLKFSIEFDFVSLTEQYPYAQPEIYDIVPFIDNKLEIQQEMKVVGITTKRDAKHKPISKKLTIGDQQLRQRQRKQQAGLTKEINSILHGGGSLPYDVLPRAVKESSELLQGTRSEIGWSEHGLLLTDKSNPNYVTLINSSGIGVSNDGGQTFEEAIRRGAINANLITAGALNANYIRGGTLDANLVRVVGGDSDKYISMENDEMNLYGTYKRTWQGKTSTNEVFTRFKDGHLRFRNNDENRSIYMSDFGISTYIDGDSSDASGTLEFFDYTYSDARGVTLQSGLGVVALRSDANRMVLEADDTVNIGSNKYSIYMRPYSSTRMGVNEFQFYIKDNPKATETDGALLYGNLTGSGTKMGSGLRFSKQQPVVYATNENGDIDSGYFYGAGFQGDWLAKDTNVYACVDGALRVTDMKGYNNGYPNYKDIQAKDIQAGSIRTMSGNFYIGVSTNELRVTNNLLYNGGDIGYKPIRASAFNDASLEEYKRDIKKWNHDALTDITERTQLYSFKYKDDEKNKQHYGLVIGDGYETPENLIDDDGVNLYDMLAHSYRAIQQLNEKVEALENGK